MPSIARGVTADGDNPVLDIYTWAGNPPVLTDVEELEFRILDISTDAKKGSPVQVYPTTAAPSYQTLDPTQDWPSGSRLGTVGRNAATWEVPLDSALGDYKIEWRYKKTALHPQEVFSEEFTVLGEGLLTAESYCDVSDVRREGFDSSIVSDERIRMLAKLATLYVKKVTGRWFHPLTFDSVAPMKLDGHGGRQQFLHIPIIRLDKLSIENQGLINADLTEIDLAVVRVYNRHVSGMTRPDDRENPRIAFIQTRIPEVVTSGLYPAPRIFPEGRQNIFLEGVFGYTDPDGSAFGKTPDLIRQVTCRLVTRDLYLDSEVCKKLPAKNAFRIVSDKEGSTTIRLQELWLKGAFTGDPEIDNILMAYKRPPDFAAV